jgi:hypothetical protein
MPWEGQRDPEGFSGNGPSGMQKTVDFSQCSQSLTLRLHSGRAHGRGQTGKEDAETLAESPQVAFLPCVKASTIPDMRVQAAKAKYPVE